MRLGLFFFILLLSCNLSASELSQFKANHLNYIQVQKVRSAIVKFYKQKDRGLKFEEPTSSYFHFNFLVEVYAADGDTCFYGGWPSIEKESRCTHPSKISTKNFNGESFTGCSGNLFRCNSDLYGQNTCVENQPQGRSITEACSSSSQGKIADITDNLKKNPERLNRMMASIQGYCNRKKDDDDCNDLKRRLEQIRSGNVDRENNFLQQQKAKESFAILKSCRDQYNKENNEGWDIGIFGTSRKSFEGIVSTINPCLSIDSEMLTPSFLEIKDDFDKLNSDFVSTELLNKATLISTELSLKSALVNMIKYDDVSPSEIQAYINNYKKDFPQLNTSPFNSIIEKSLQDIRNAQASGKLKPVNKNDVMDSFKSFGSKLNNLCHDIRSKYNNSTIKKGKIVNSSEEDSFYKDQQRLIYNEIESFRNQNADAWLMSSAHFLDDVFPINSNIAEDCAEDDLQEPFNTKLSLEDLNLAIKDQKDILNNELKQANDLAESIKKKNSDSIEDGIHDLIKYRPQILGQILKQNDFDLETQNSMAKYLCQQTLDVYNTDEIWRGAEMVAVGASVALMFTGVGSPLGIALNAAIISADLTMAARDLNDAWNIEEGSQSGFTLNLTSSSNFSDQMTSADSQKTWAMVSAAAGVGDALVTGFKLVKQAGKIGSRAIETKPMLRASEVSSPIGSPPPQTINGLEAVGDTFDANMSIVQSNTHIPAVGAIFNQLNIWGQSKISNMVHIMRRTPKVVENLNGSIVFHGSRSDSLLGLISKDPELDGLIPTGELLRKGRAPFSGELQVGATIKGVNNKSLSTTSIYDIDSAFEYTEIAAKDRLKFTNPDEYRAIVQKQIDEDKAAMAKVKASNEKYSQNFIDRFESSIRINQQRLDSLGGLSADELDVLKQDFPIVYGMNPDPNKVKYAGKAGTQDISEFAVVGGVRSSEINVVFVPQEKIPYIQELFKKYGRENIAIQPIEFFNP